MQDATQSIYDAFAPFISAQNEAIETLKGQDRKIIHLQKMISHVLKAHGFSLDFIKLVRELRIAYIYADDGSISILDDEVAATMGMESRAEFEARTGIKVFR